jgi:hypothetical protein
MKGPLLFLCVGALLGGCAAGPAGKEYVLDTGPATATVMDTLLFGVRDVSVTADGDVWVLSRHEPFIRRFRAGQLVASFGRSGEGPGEFRAPWSFVGGDRLIPPRVFDPGTRLIIRLDSAGRELTRASFRTTWGFVRSDIEDVSYGQVFRALSISDTELVSLVYLADVGTTRDLRRSALVRFRADGTPLDTVVSFRVLFGSQAEGSTPRWLVTIPLVAACDDGTTAVYDGMAPEIRGYGRGAQPVWRLAMPARMARGRGLPAADLERYVRHRVLGELLENQGDTSRLEPLVGQQLRGGRSLYASTAPPVVALLCDPQGRVWLQEFDTRDDALGKGRMWTVIGRRGTSAMVRVPAGFTPLRFQQGTLIGIVRDSLGVETVGTVTIPNLTPTLGGV